MPVLTAITAVRLEMKTLSLPLTAKKHRENYLL